MTPTAPHGAVGGPPVRSTPLCPAIRAFDIVPAGARKQIVTRGDYRGGGIACHLLLLKIK